ncbi:MAG: hypothetical protein Q7S92_00055 [Candidatus Diapherotrites archaeon]|nr:hypothetical protein [Candidatus Diapherotrites archaeon]
MNSHFWIKFLGLFLAFILLTIPVLGSHQTGLRDSCDGLHLRLNAVQIEEGQSIRKTFLLQNFALENFALDSVQAYDYNSGIIVSGADYDRIILGGNTGFFSVQIQALQNTDLEKGLGFIDIFGHFQSGQTCSLDRQIFNVTIVQPRSSTPEFSSGTNCSKFSLQVPSRVLVQQNGSINFTAENNSNQAYIVHAQGQNVDVLNSEETIPARSKADLSVFYKIQNNADTGSIVWNASSTDCTMHNQATELVNLSKPTSLASANVQTSQTPPIPVEGPIQTQTTSTQTNSIGIQIQTQTSSTTPVTNIQTPPAQNSGQNSGAIQTSSTVDLKTQTTRDGSNYKIEVELKNNFSETIEGNLEIVIPQDWNVQGLGLISLNAGETKKMEITIMPSANFTQNVLAEVKFSFPQGMERMFVQLTPLQAQAQGLSSSSVAFAVLDANMTLGLILALIILSWAFWNRFLRNETTA